VCVRACVFARTYVRITSRTPGQTLFAIAHVARTHDPPRVLIDTHSRTRGTDSAVTREREKEREERRERERGGKGYRLESSEASMLRKFSSRARRVTQKFSQRVTFCARSVLGNSRIRCTWQRLFSRIRRPSPNENMETRVSPALRSEERRG